jgi:hypothetical protein
MTNEAVIVELMGNNGDKMSVTVSDGTAIPKGSLMVLTDPRAAIIHAAVDTPFTGIADFEKAASDGITEMTVVTNCIAKLVVKTGGTAVTIGDTVSLSSEVNAVELGTTLDDEKGWTVGKSLENAASAETFQCRVKALS